MWDIVSPISTITASDILEEVLEKEEIEEEPDLFTAIRIADGLRKKYGMYVRPEFLIDFSRRRET